MDVLRPYRLDVEFLRQNHYSENPWMAAEKSLEPLGGNHFRMAVSARRLSFALGAACRHADKLQQSGSAPVQSQVPSRAFLLCMVAENAD